MFEVSPSLIPENGQHFTYVLEAPQDPVTKKIPVWVGGVWKRSVARRMQGHLFLFKYGKLAKLAHVFNRDRKFEAELNKRYKASPMFLVESQQDGFECSEEQRKAFTEWRRNNGVDYSVVNKKRLENPEFVAAHAKRMKEVGARVKAISISHVLRAVAAGCTTTPTAHRWLLADGVTICNQTVRNRMNEFKQQGIINEKD